MQTAAGETAKYIPDNTSSEKPGGYKYEECVQMYKYIFRSINGRVIAVFWKEMAAFTASAALRYTGMQHNTSSPL